MWTQSWYVLVYITNHYTVHLNVFFIVTEPWSNNIRKEFRMCKRASIINILPYLIMISRLCNLLPKMEYLCERGKLWIRVLFTTRCMFMATLSIRGSNEATTYSLVQIYFNFHFYLQRLTQEDNFQRLNVISWIYGYRTFTILVVII